MNEIILLVLGGLIGAYAAWGFTWLWFKTRSEDGGDGGTEVPDFVPEWFDPPPPPTPPPPIPLQDRMP